MTRATANANRAQVPASFARVDVVPDSPAWEEERRHSLGASEIAAVLGVSPYSTPLDVYRGKHGDTGGREIDPELAFIGHAEEYTVARWLRRFHPEIGVLRRGFMARSTEHPWLHASFDRLALRQRVSAPVQIKTAGHWARADWADEVPLHVAVQVQAELAVHGGAFAWAVGFVGGRRFHLHRVDRDEAFIRGDLLPAAERFWVEHVVAGVPPAPSSPAEAVSLWPGDGDVLTADDELLDLVDRLLDAEEYLAGGTAAVAELKLAIQVRMRQATTLVDPLGDVLVTWNPRAGSSRIDRAALTRDHPDLAAAYTVTSAPTRTFIRKTTRERARA